MHAIKQNNASNDVNVLFLLVDYAPFKFKPLTNWDDLPSI